MIASVTVPASEVEPDPEVEVLEAASTTLEESLGAEPPDVVPEVVTASVDEGVDPPLVV